MKLLTLTEKEITKFPYSRIVISNKTSYHNHTFFEFSICLSGNLNNEINGKQYAINKGHILLLRPQDCHIVNATSHTSRDIYVTQDNLKRICDIVSPELFNQITSDELVINFDVSTHDLSFIESELSFFNKTNVRRLWFFKRFGVFG